MGADDGLQKLAFASAAEWEAWLEENHAAADGVWIKMAKKGSGVGNIPDEKASRTPSDPATKKGTGSTKRTKGSSAVVPALPPAKGLNPAVLVGAGAPQHYSFQKGRRTQPSSSGLTVWTSSLTSANLQPSGSRR